MLQSGATLRAALDAIDASKSGHIVENLEISWKDGLQTEGDLPLMFS